MRLALVPVLVLTVVAGCTSRRVVSGRDLVEAPDRFDGRPVVISGIVEDPRPHAPSTAGGYTTFTLRDGSTRVPVAVPGTQTVSAGDLVEVRGVFREQVRVGGDALVDTVEATSVRPLGAASPPPGTPVGPP